uniref:LeucinetRNA ligaseic/mitochondrial n=1 Tax=Rhizophora mucronata TaxID=61149 RepID=A0A2P2MC39_RHIMU
MGKLIPPLLSVLLRNGLLSVCLLCWYR